MLFPTSGDNTPEPEGILVIEPYRVDGGWVFDDPTVGLKEEPFVGGVNDMINAAIAEIPDAVNGFRLLFAVAPFEGYQFELIHSRADPVDGHWYRINDPNISEEEGWLCPALYRYFPTAPEHIYVKAEPRRE